MRIFHGQEAEGPWRGASTLFISDEVIEIDELIFALERTRNKKIEQIYFGAGGNRKLPFKIFDNIPGLAKRFRIIFEIGKSTQLKAVPQYLLKFVHVVLCISVNGSNIDKINSIKLLGQENLAWFGPVEPIITSLSDPLYSRDKEVI